MLTRIRLNNFKSFAESEEVSLAPLTLLVGANASGKSNLFDAIRLLKGAAMGMTLEEVISEKRVGGSLTWPGIRGGLQELTYGGAPSFTLETTWSTLSPATELVDGVPQPQERRLLTHAMTCSVNGGAQLTHERIELADGEFLVEVSTNAHGRVAVQSEEDSRSTLLIPADKILVGLHRLPVEWGLFQRWDARGRDALLRLWHAMSAPMFLELVPAAMRGYGNVHRPFGEQGENFAGRLASYCKDEEARRSLIDWLAQICAPEITDIDFVENELGDVMVRIYEQGRKKPISARSISDGTLRFLGTFVALQVLDPGPVVLIEEIDTGLHPTRIRVLVEFLEQVTRSRGIQVIATTHSPVVLQWMSEEALRNTVVFGRTPERQGSIMRRLGDLPQFDEVVARRGIDELFTTGWMEMAL